MRAQPWAIFLAAGFLFFSAERGWAQCDPGPNVTGSAAITDGSTPPPICQGTVVAVDDVGRESAPATFPLPGPFAIRMDVYADGSPGHWRFLARGCGYYVQPSGPSGDVTCTREPGTSCPHCTGSPVNLSVVAALGSISGSITELPSGTPALAGTRVIAKDGIHGDSASVLADRPGHYTFTSSHPLLQMNHWALPVYPEMTGTAGMPYGVSVEGPAAAPNPVVQVTVHSSREANADVIRRAPFMEEPDIRPDPDPGPDSDPDPPCPPEWVGEPVSVVSGNAFFDHTDTDIPGVGLPLRFVRSYNSRNRGSGQYGVFGPGWLHPYEQRLTFPAARIILLRRGDGVPTYFQDTDGDLRYDASVPFTKESWITKQGDGTFVRSFRKGGTETYDSSGRLVELADASGNTTTLTRTAGLLTDIEDAGGRALTLSYESGRLVGLAGPDGVIASYLYDTSQRLREVRYPEGSGYKFTYDGNGGPLLTVTDLADVLVEKHSYDDQGRALTSEIGGGQEKYTLDYAAFRTTVTDGRGNVSVYDHASIWGERHVTKVTGPCACAGGGGQTAEWTYDDKGRVLSHKDGEGNVTTYTYDSNTGDLLTETRPARTRCHLHHDPNPLS